jgi:V/A-type H+-transporting ATPase subunit A
MFQDEAEKALQAGVYLDKLLKMEVRDKIARAKYVSEEQSSKIDEIETQLKEEIEKLIKEEGVSNA